jgi:DNA-binding transcriptional MocR family regulator
MALIRKSEFARIKGVSAAAVSQAIKSGRIRGAVVTRGGREWIDHDLALELWERNTLQQPPPTAAAPRAVPAAEAPGPTDEQLRAFIRGLPEDQIPDLNESRARREHYQAEKARLEALQGRGELVPAEDVKREAFALGRQIRDAMQGIPDRVASLLAAATDVREVHRMLSEEIRVALRGLADG